ncbi:OCIA domain-containing protein 1 isoform 2-T2 [Spinachia spinachia]
MSSATTGFTGELQPAPAQSRVGVDYIPTEEERRVFKECQNESFWYRSVPFCVVGVTVTQVLVAKGILSPSPRFGSLPKVVFAGFCGILAGKMSYMKACQEKFKRLDNSPLGETLRQRTGMSPQPPTAPQSAMADLDTASFDPMFQQADAPVHAVPDNRDDGYGYGYNAPMGKEDDFGAAEGEPRKKATLYENLRLKNRENYEVMLNQKADALVKAPSEKEPRGYNKDVKKNIYGDSWEE